MLAAISVGCCIYVHQNDKKYCPTPLHYTAGYIQISQACITYSKFLMFVRCIFSLSKTSFKDSFVTCRFFTGSTNLFTHKYQSFKKVCTQTSEQIIDTQRDISWMPTKGGLNSTFITTTKLVFMLALDRLKYILLKNIFHATGLEFKRFNQRYSS